GVVHRRGAGRAAAEPRRPLGVGPRAAAAPRRRAGAGARRARRGRARLRDRPAPIRLAEAAGHAELAEELALAGYERVERVEERGQFAVRGDLIDVFP